MLIGIGIVTLIEERKARREQAKRAFNEANRMLSARAELRRQIVQAQAQVREEARRG